MWSVAVDVWIGNAAAVLSGCWGAVTRRAHETGLSRTSIYHHAHRVEQAVVHEQAGGLSYETLWAEHERLRTENEALWEAWAAAEGVPEAKQQACAATGAWGRSSRCWPFFFRTGLARVGQRWGAGSPRQTTKLGCCWRYSISSVSGGYWCYVWMKFSSIVSLS